MFAPFSSNFRLKDEDGNVWAYRERQWVMCSEAPALPAPRKIKTARRVKPPVETQLPKNQRTTLDLRGKLDPNFPYKRARHKYIKEHHPELHKLELLRRKEQQKLYGGTCRHCGGPTNGSSGRAKAPKCCKRCLWLHYPPANKGKGPIQQKTLAFLTEPRRFSEIRDHLGITSDHAGGHLDRMLRGGFIRRPSRGVYILNDHPYPEMEGVVMARKTVLVCDKCGKEVEDGKGALLRLTYSDARKMGKQADVCDSCAGEMPGNPAARRGRKPKAVAT